MIPQHVLDVLKNLTSEQQSRFQELCMWAGDSGIQGMRLPINYDSLLEQVQRMGASPVKPVEAPAVIDHELMDRIKILKGG